MPESFTADDYDRVLIDKNFQLHRMYVSSSLTDALASRLVVGNMYSVPLE